MPPRVKWDPNALYELRRSPEVVADLDRRAEAVAEAANATNDLALYVTGSQQGEKRPQGRWRATVVTANAVAMNSNAKNNTLIESLEAGRG